MKKIVFLLTLALNSLRLPVYGQQTESDQYLRAFDGRSRAIFSLANTTTPGGYAEATILYVLNQNFRRADSTIIELLRNPRGDMFWMFNTISSYLYGKEKMSPEAKAAIRRAWKTYTPYRGDTENHWCLYYSSLLLASQEWPNLPGSEWFNGKTSAENYIEAKEYLIHWMRITTTIGQGEFDSPVYFPVFVSPMMVLSQFANESEIKTRGLMMADYLFADFAVDHLDGQYTGGVSRVSQNTVYNPLSSNAAPFAYLYFGCGEPRVGEFTLFAALSSYRLPEIIYWIATDRSVPYTQMEKKRVRNVIRYGKEMNPPVYKYMYMTKDYALGSVQGGLLQPIQQHTWGVNFTHGGPFTTIFGLHPYWSVLELGMFFPEEVQFIMADVLLTKSTYNSPDKWTGGSPFEQTFQDKNSLIVLYDIPRGTASDHIDGFFPDSLEQRLQDTSGWILCEAGDVYVGWYPLQTPEWKKEQGYWRLRSTNLQNGCIIEVRSKSEVDSFESFCQKMKTHIPGATLTPGNVSVRYTNLSGDLMEFSFARHRVLNGKAVDLSQYKLFEGPFLNAEVGSEEMAITYKDKIRILDFQSLRIADRKQR